MLQHWSWASTVDNKTNALVKNTRLTDGAFDIFFLHGSIVFSQLMNRKLTLKPDEQGCFFIQGFSGSRKSVS